MAEWVIEESTLKGSYANSCVLAIGSNLVVGPLARKIVMDDATELGNYTCD